MKTLDGLILNPERDAGAVPLPGKYTKRHLKEKRKKLAEKEIERICQKYQVQCRILGDSVFLTTAFGKWIVTVKGTEVVQLRHGNYHQNSWHPIRGEKYINEYHTQDLPSKKFEQVVCYVKHHDEKRIRRMTRKTRIEKLFEKIEKEREDLA